MNNRNYDMLCPLNPENVGLNCPNQGRLKGVPEAECKHCGWNPEVAKKRHEQTLKRILFKDV